MKKQVRYTVELSTELTELLNGLAQRGRFRGRDVSDIAGELLEAGLRSVGKDGERRRE